MFGSTLTRPRKGRRILVALICITLLFLLYSYGHVVSYKLGVCNNSNNTNTTKPGSELIVDQPSCKIPRTDIMPEYFRTDEGTREETLTSQTNWMPNCSYEKQLIVLEGDDDNYEVLRLLPGEGDIPDIDRAPPRNCCVSEITRKHPLSDRGYNLSSCEPLRASMNVHGKQMLFVKCGERLNFEATIPMDTPGVLNKVKYWNREDPAGTKPTRPISVLILAIDTVSRSHAHRSLPRTLDFMTSRMDFIDFQGYHSIGPHTLPNLMAFLIGMSQAEVRRTCAPDWSSTWDKCPFIWNEFDAKNYVTMYAEDGDGWQTFNWGGQSGFQKEPTDYYLLPLFDSIHPLRDQHSTSMFLRWLNKTEGPIPWQRHGACTSNETIPQFMLRYTRRFLDKFSPKADSKSILSTPPPFFALPYWNYPMHNDLYTLPTMDGDLLDLMRHLNEQHKSMLESTLILVYSDHGDRFSFFDSASIEAYIERSLPMLYIRVPEELRRRFPEYSEALEWNAANRLVTSFDLHHTLKHLLHLDNLDSSKTSKKFVPVLEDRSSLFHRVSGTRTCDQMHMYPEVCVCNILLNPEPLTDSSILNKLMQFVVDKLNEFGAHSDYSGLCVNWTAGANSILSAKILNNRQDWLSSGRIVLLKFKADPLGAAFEVRVRVWLTEGGGNETQAEWSGAEIWGEFIRINSYGGQSFCIPRKSDRDRKMKELCVCVNFLTTTTTTLSPLLSTSDLTSHLHHRND